MSTQLDEIHKVLLTCKTCGHWKKGPLPPRPPGPHSEMYDGEAASVARLTCDNVTREFNMLYENPAARDQGGDPSD